MNLKTIIKSCLALYCLSQVLFFAHLNYSPELVFDEHHYVPAAKDILRTGLDPVFEHPPLGKAIIAAGLTLFGDGPLGWRFFSTVFGALCVVGVFLWAVAIYESISIGWWAAFFTIVDQVLYVQSRVAMTDVFMMSFIALGTAFFFFWWRTERSLFMALAGLFLGAALSVKWFGLVPLAGCFLLFAIRCGTHAAPRGKAARVGEAAMLLGIPLVIYYALFRLIPPDIEKEVPGFTLFSALNFAWFAQHFPTEPHRYNSQWYQWALTPRPIWYFVGKDESAPERLRAMVYYGNPVVMWAGLWAVITGLWSGIQQKRLEPLLVPGFYLAFYLFWAVSGRHYAFYYYYFPAAVVLGIALAGRMPALLPRTRNLVGGLAFAVFLYFFPMLCGKSLAVETWNWWKWLT